MCRWATPPRDWSFPWEKYLENIIDPLHFPHFFTPHPKAIFNCDQTFGPFFSSAALKAVVYKCCRVTTTLRAGVMLKRNVGH